MAHRRGAVVAFAAIATLVVGCMQSTEAPAGRPYRSLTRQHPVVAAAGDIACPDAPCAPDRATAVLLSRIDPDLVLALGDNQYREGTLAEFRSSYDRTWGAFKPRTRPVPGNHEYRTPGAAGYFRYFGPAAGGDNGGDYSFDLGRWHLVALNSAAPGAISDQQLDWVRSDLTSSANRCQIVYWHHPPFTSGAVEGGDPTPELGALWTLLYQEGVEVVLNGHAHQYERFAPLGADGAIDQAMGIREFVVGTGGGKPHPFDEEPVDGSRVRIPDVHGVLEIALRSTGYDWRFVDIDAMVLDHGAGRCHR